MVRPLVSIITPTIPERHDLLMECIENIAEQTYSEIEHVIVSDGQDDVLRERLGGLSWSYRGEGKPHIRTFCVELGRHWTGFLSDSHAAAPVIVGQLLARGEYHMLLADDERMLAPDHVDALVDLLESSGADFVYPKVRMYRVGQQPADGWDIGSDPPRWGQITHWLYRPSMIEKARGPYLTHMGRSNDWEFIERALSGGATWAFLPRVTLSHRADQ